MLGVAHGLSGRAEGCRRLPADERRPPSLTLGVSLFCYPTNLADPRLFALECPSEGERNREEADRSSQFENDGLDIKVAPLLGGSYRCD